MKPTIIISLIILGVVLSGCSSTTDEVIFFDGEAHIVNSKYNTSISNVKIVGNTVTVTYGYMGPGVSGSYKEVWVDCDLNVVCYSSLATNSRDQGGCFANYGLSERLCNYTVTKKAEAIK